MAICDEGVGMQVLYAITLEPKVDGPEDLDAAFERMRSITASWAASARPSTPGRPSPRYDEVLESQGETLVDTKRVHRTGFAVPGSASRSWELEVREALGSDGAADFVSHVSVSRTATRAGIHITLGRRMLQQRLAPAPYDYLNRPRLVPMLLDGLPMRSRGEPMDGHPQLVWADGVSSLVERLKDPEAHFPVVVVASESPTGPEAAFATRLADRLGGLAHVVQLVSFMAYDKFNSHELGEVSLHGARLFWPGRVREYRHPEWLDVANTRRGQVSDVVFGMLARLSAVLNGRDDLKVEVSREDREARRELLDAQVQRATSSGEAAAAVEGLQRALRREQDAAYELMQENYELEERLARLTLKQDAAEEAQHVMTDLAEQLADTRRRVKESEDARWDQFWDALEAASSFAIRFDDHCRKGWPDCGYLFPDRMREYVTRLSMAAVEWSRSGAQVGHVKEFFGKYGLEYAFGDKGLGKVPFTFDGQDHQGAGHIKVDDHKKPNRCLRIHFALDSKHAPPRLLVHHVGLHL